MREGFGEKKASIVGEWFKLYIKEAFPEKVVIDTWRMN